MEKMLGLHTNPFEQDFTDVSLLQVICLKIIVN